jgi:MinD superfamily P-loop ATPase
MKQLAIISGKGGTGKTTLAASLAALAPNAIMADCDVDAPDLHLLLPPTIDAEHDFVGGKTAIINPTECSHCGICVGMCRFQAISNDLKIDPLVCEGCGVCVDHCPDGAIYEFADPVGKWFESTTDFAPMVHAILRPGQDNSGKLVAQVRRHAAEWAEQIDAALVIVDGPPGVGCPVISAVTNTDLVLVVTEPSPSGLHDMQRALDLTAHFDTPTVVAINKADLAPEQHGASVIAEIPYDTTAVDAMMQARPVATGEGPLADAHRQVWRGLAERLMLNETQGEKP